jgi:hypothetical protein
MAKVEEYAQWIIENADKKGTKEFNIVAQAYQEAKGISVEPTAFEKELAGTKTDTGFTGAFSAGKERLKGDVALLAGKTGLMSLEDAERYKREKDALAQRMFKPTEESFTEAPLLKFRELLGGSLPYMAAPVAAGLGAKVLGVGAGVGLAGAGLASLGQFTGSNLSRQMETGKNLEETSLGKAAAAAVPQTALDVVSLRMIPSIGRLFGAAGKEVTPELAKKIAEQGMLRTTAAYGAGSAKLAGVEGATEVGQQFLERLQAGLNISDEQARDEYFDSFIGGAVLGGTLAVPGTYLERGATVSKGKQMEKEEQQQAILDRQKAQQEAQQQAALEQRQQLQETKQNLGVSETLALPAPDKKYVEPSEDDPLFNPLGRFQTTDLSAKEITEINQRRQAMGKARIGKTFSIEDLADVFTPEESKTAEGVLGRLVASRTGFQAGNDIPPDILNLAAQERGISIDTQGFRDFLERTTGATTTKKEEDKIRTLSSKEILENMSPPQRLAVKQALDNIPVGSESQVLQPGITTVKHYTPEQYNKTINGVNKEFTEMGDKPNGRESVLKQIEKYSGLTRRKDQQRLLDQAILSGDLERVIEVRNVNGVEKNVEIIQKPTPRQELPGGMDIRKETFKQGETPDLYEIRSGSRVINQKETAEEAEEELVIHEKNRQSKIIDLEKQIASLQDGIQKREAELLNNRSLGQDQDNAFFIKSANYYGQDQVANEDIANLRQQQQTFAQPIQIVPVGTRALTQNKFTYYEKGKPTVKFDNEEKAEAYGISRLNDQTLQQIIDSAPSQKQTGRVKRYVNLAQKELDSRTGKKPEGIEITTKQGLEGAEERLEKLGLVKKEAQEKLTANLDAFRKSLLPTLKRFGLEKIGLNIVDSIENGKADGFYVQNLITLALDAKDVMGTLRHESIHAIKELGGFTDAEWRVLTNKAKTEWVQQFIKDRGLFKRYQDQYKQDYGSLKGFDEYVQEEAIAEAFRFYSKNKLPAGMIGNIIVRLQKFFEALRNSFNKLGFTTADDIFTKVEEGGIKTLEPVKEGKPVKYDQTKRIDMDFKKVTERIPELQEGMAKLEAGEITAKQYDKLVNKYKTIMPYDFVPKPATRAEAIGAIEDKETYGVPSKTLKNGHPVGLRLDIPAYSRYGVWVPTIHEQASGFGAGKKIGHESVAMVTNATFGMSEKAAASIAGGKPKGTIATIKGNYKKISEKDAVAKAEEALNDPTWTQIGMDPERHSYFYDRKTTEPVISADEVIQIGPLVLAKNAVYAPKSQFKYSLPEEAKPEKEVKARTMQDLNQAIPAKDRVVSKDPTKLIDGKSFLEADLDETGFGFLPFEEMGETETNRAILDMWNKSIEESGGDYVRKIVTDLNATPPTAAFLNNAFSLPNSARYWYELSAQKVNSLPIPSQFKDLLINLISATSGQTKPLDNMKRAISVLSEVIQGKPVETDLISAKTVENAIRNPDLETLKFGNFAGTMKFVSGMTNKAPTTTNDLQVADIFNMDANAFGKNPVLYEVVSRFYNKVRDLQNSFIPEQMQPYESWQIQALTWVENRGDKTSYQEKTNDDYAQAIDKISKELKNAGIPLVNDKIGLSTLKDPNLTRTLRPTVSLFQESFKATVESNTLLNKEGKEANDEFELIKDLDLPWAKKLVTKFERIQREAFEKIVSEKVVNQLIKAIVGRAANVTRIDSSSNGTYEGKVSPNMRIPMFYKNSQNIPFKLDKSEINVLLAILGKELDQAAMAASLFTPVDGKGDTFRILIPNKTVSEEEISAFDRAVGYPINFFQAANGGVLEINVGGYDTKPTLDVVKNAIMDVFGDVKAKYIESGYDSTYITKDKVPYAQSYEEVIDEFRESKFGGSDQAGLRTAFDRIIEQEANRLQSIASTRNKKFKEFTEESKRRRDKGDKEPVKNKYSLALGSIDPTTFLVSEKNPNNTGNLAFMPGSAPLAKYPIRLPVGTHDDITDKGYGANHILRRMQTDVARRPSEVTKERLEDLILHIESLGSRFKRVYRSGPNLVLYDPLTDDAMFVKPLSDHYEVQTMYSDSRIPFKYGDALWSGKNVQPPEAKKFEEKQRGIMVQASKEGRVEPKPVGVRVKQRVIDPSQVESYAEKESTKGTLSLKKKMSLRAPDTPEVDAFMNRIEGESKIVNEDGTPKIYYHGTAQDITEFRPKQAGAIFLTDNPKFAGSFSDLSKSYMERDAFQSASPTEQIYQLKTVKRLLEEEGRDTDSITKDIKTLTSGRKLSSDFYLDGGYSDLLDYVNRDTSGAQNILPVFVYSRNPFDYQKSENVEKLLKTVNEEELNSLLPYVSFDPNRLKKRIQEGSWSLIERKEFQSALKRAGFDSFYVSEGGNKNLAVYDSSQIKSAFNVAPTKESKDIRYSFNAPPETHTKLESANTAGKRLTDSINGIIKMFKDPEERIKTRIAFIDPNSGLAKRLQNEEIYTNGVLRGDLLARAKAQTINLIRNGLQTGIPTVNSDGSLIIEIDEINNLANSQVIADRLNDNYYVKGSGLSGRGFVAEVARALRGKEIMEEDRIHNAKTGEKRNREKQVTQKQIDWAEQQLKDVPEMQEIFDIWKKVNTGLINLWENVGLFSKKEADTYRAKKFYVSLAASNTDLETMMERQLGFTASGLKSTPKVQKLEGADFLRDKDGKVVLDEEGNPVPLQRNIWENIDKQYASMLAGAYQNQVRKVAITQLIDAGAARIPIKKRNGVDVGNPDAQGINLRYKDPTNPYADDKGVVHVVVDNATDLAAFESMHYELGPVLKFFGGATNILRAGALLNPMFWIRQLIRDPIHASIVANGGIVTPFHSAKEYINILRNNSEEAKILASRGVIGQYDSTLDLQTFLDQVGTEKVDQGNVQKMFHKLMLMHEASDAATRVAIFKKEKQSALDKGMTEEDAVNYAVMKSREAINFLVHGNSKVLNAARQMIPFLSASITSLDTVYRAATGYNLPASEKEAAKKLFKQRAALMFGSSVAYAMLMQDDEEYQKQPNYVKDNNWLIKNPIGEGFLKVAVPYEVGFLFKVVPEVALRYAYGNDTGKEMVKAYKDGLLHNLPTGGVPVPQAIKPALETIVNYSFFTGNPVESIGESRLPVEARGRNASETAKFLSGAGLGFVGLSPSKIDNLVQGYFAEAGTFMFGLADQLVYTLQGTEGAAKNLEKQPFFKAFMTDPNADKSVANFFDIQQTANRTAQGFTDFKNSGRLEEAREMVEDEEKKMLIASAPILRKFSENMSKVRKQIEIVKNDQSRTPEERRELVNKLTAQYNIIAKQGVRAADTLGIR